MWRWLFLRRAPAKASGKKALQYAALPWRRQPDGLVEVLVVTSRETRRWVIPKGWPIKGLGPGPSAAQEAFEEAGVAGRVEDQALGAYRYHKRLRSERTRDVRVDVFALEVWTEAEDWPEKGQREHRWVRPAEAATMVDEPGLQLLIAAFAP